MSDKELIWMSVKNFFCDRCGVVLFLKKFNFKNLLIYFMHEYSVCLYACMPEEGIGSHYKMTMNSNVVAGN